MMNGTRVLLAVPHPALRQAIRESLESRGDIEVAAKVGAGPPTLEAAQ